VPRHVGLPFLDASRKSSFSLFHRTPSVSYVVLLLSYSYKSKLRNLLVCWFKVKLILGQKPTLKSRATSQLKIVNHNQLQEIETKEMQNKDRKDNAFPFLMLLLILLGLASLEHDEVVTSSSLDNLLQDPLDLSI